MLEIRKSASRGHADHGWLNSHHSFSFGKYYDPEHSGFGPLLVINEDRVLGGKGFGQHSHQDMEIVSYVLQGALEHKDSMGNTSVLRYGDVQRMSAGTGVTHSEFNHSDTNTVHFLQIWIEPNQMGIKPGYEEKHFDPKSKHNQLRLIASVDGREGSLLIHQEANVYAGILDGDVEITHQLLKGRKTYVHVIRGQVKVNELLLSTGDAAKITDIDSIAFSEAQDAEMLVFDLP